MANELKPIDQIKNTLMSPMMASQLKMVLPEHISVEKFQRIAMTAIINNPDIQNCTVNTVMSSLIKCATDGLQPDGKEAAIVAYGNKAQYMPMAYGVIKRIRNSGEVSDVSAHVVYEKDKFSYIVENGRPIMRHEPNFMEADRGKLVFAYAVAVMKDNEVHVEAVSKMEIEKARNAGKAANGPAWKNWYDEMAKKTAVHRLNKYVPTSADLSKMIIRATRDPEEVEEQEQITSRTAPQSLIDQINSSVEETVDTVTGELVDSTANGQLQV
jgi:recombination protein RecT